MPVLPVAISRKDIYYLSYHQLASAHSCEALHNRMFSKSLTASHGTMDNLRLYDFLVRAGPIVRAFCIGTCLLAGSAGELSADADVRSGASADITTWADRNSPSLVLSIRKIQRLLKLLASRHPARYKSVDPGRLDGVLGEETKSAIRNFRSIAGLPNDTKFDPQLTQQILAELALMSTTDEEASPTLDCSATPAAAECNTRTSSWLFAETPQIGDLSRDQAGATGDTAAAPTKPGVGTQGLTPALEPPSAQANSATTAPATVAQQGKPVKENEKKLYFVQVASLRSLIAAKREWARIEVADRAALQWQQVYFEQADIKDRGIFYRVLIGPQRSRTDANTLCSFFKQKDQSCVVAMRDAADIEKTAELRTADREPGAADRSVTAVDRIAAPTEGVPKSSAAPIPSAPSSTPPSALPPAAPSLTGTATATLAPEPAAADTNRPTVSAAPISAGTERTPTAIESPERVPAGNESSAASANTAIGASPSPPAAVDDAASITTENILPPPGPEPAAHAKAANISAVPSAAAPRDLPALSPNTDAKPAEAAGKDQSFYDWATGEIAAQSRLMQQRLWRRRREVTVLLVLLVIGGLLYRRHVLKQRIKAAHTVVTNRLPLPGVIDGLTKTSQTIATLEEDFKSQQLRHSRRIRDEFLSSILAEFADDPYVFENKESAIRVNGSLKELLESNPVRYKSIFLNLIFLSKLGAALNRNEVTLDQLDDQINRELGLLRSYFKIHLLELDDRHRIRTELPGLFYCLQLSQLHEREQSVSFSAA